MRFRTCCCLLIPVVLIGSCLTSFAIYILASGGGYWENRPPLDRLSGPLRFMQYVCLPPGNVHGLSGGYSGYPQEYTATRFTFTGDFPEERCLKHRWQEKPVDELDGILWIELSPDAVTHAYVYMEDGQPTRYLLLDENNGRGYLYVP
jgi:hypothetical protein